MKEFDDTYDHERKFAEGDVLKESYKLRQDAEHYAQQMLVRQKNNLEQLPKKRGAGQFFYTIHIIKRGDTLSELAKKCGCTVEYLKALNGYENDRIYVGQYMKLPAKSLFPFPFSNEKPLKPDKKNIKLPVSPKVETSKINNKPAVSGTKFQIYTIKKGDSLSLIAKKFNTSVEALKKLNNYETDKINAGSVMKIPGSNSSTSDKDKIKPEEEKKIIAAIADTNSLLFEERITANKTEFVKKVKEISSKLEINPHWLMGVMNSESRINPEAVNKITKATGLIQFMPNTATGLGTTVDLLHTMNNLEQLDFVYKYFKSYKGKLHNYTDVYFVVFFPAAVGKPDSYILKTKNISAKTIADQNKVFDLDENHEISVGELRKAMLKRVPKDKQHLLD